MPRPTYASDAQCWVEPSPPANRRRRKGSPAPTLDCPFRGAYILTAVCLPDTSWSSANLVAPLVAALNDLPAGFDFPVVKCQEILRQLWARSDKGFGR